MAFPALTVEVAFTSTPFATPTWTDVTAFVVGGDVTRGRTSELDKIRAGQATVVLTNDDRRFDPTHTTGPYWPNVLPMRRLRIRATFDAVVYDVFHGFIDRWEQTYQHPGVAHATVTATDAFKVLAAKDLPPSVWAAEVLADHPVLWYRLGEPAGATVAYNSGSRAASHGTVSGPLTFGQAGLVTRDADTAMAGALGAVVTVEDPAAFPSGTGQPFTVEFILKTPAPGFNQPLFEQGVNTFGTGGYVMVDLNTAGTISLHLTLGGAVVSYTSTVTVTDDNPHHVMLVSPGTTTGAKIYIDGIDRTGVASGSITSHVVGEGSFTIAGSRFNPGGGYTGVLDEVAVYGAALTLARAGAHADARATPWDNETSGTRVGRILDSIDWPAVDRNIDAGQSTLQAATPTGSALAYLQKVEESEGGLLFVAKDGKVRFRGRHGGFNLPSLGTFGDGDPATELEYVDIAFDYSESLIYNEIRVSRADGVVHTAEDTASQTAYGERTYTSDGLLIASDAESLDRAHFLLGRYKDPVFRTTRMVVQPSGDTEAILFPQVLGREIGDKLTVRRKPQNVGATIDQAVTVEGMRHTFRTLSWSTEFMLSPTDTAGGMYWQAGVAGASEAGITTRASY